MLGAAAVAAGVSLVAACGGSDGAGPGGGDGSDGGGLGGAGVELTGAAREGERLAGERGCTTCHSADGATRTGPTWQGIWGEEVELEDGRTVVVDAAYVERAIRDPRADVVAGYTAQMPEIPLSDDEVDALVAYIESLG